MVSGFGLLEVSRFVVSHSRGRLQLVWLVGSPRSQVAKAELLLSSVPGIGKKMSKGRGNLPGQRNQQLQNWKLFHCSYPQLVIPRLSVSRGTHVTLFSKGKGNE